MVPRYLADFDLKTMKWMHADVCVVGSGVAGLYSSLKISEYADVLLICKSSLQESNTRYAQGGIAAVMTQEDSPELHLQDTISAGAGLCSEEAVRVLVTEGPAGVHDLMAMGTTFDKEGGQLALTKEGAHSRRRILHANGDSTGAEVVRALAEKVQHSSRITVLEEHYAVDLVTEDGAARGMIVSDPNGQLFFVQSSNVVLATGGAGQLYRYTTNPQVATGDGVAMAYRAGAEIKDVEFIQFHPTSLCYPGAPRFLISEAVRGEGAVLRNTDGERFMEKYHPQLELAPRDVVARAILQEMENTGSAFVYLDITHEEKSFIKHRFPKIYEVCLEYGMDMAKDWIPVAPAAHYIMGGVKTNLQGETTIHGLFACGEVSCTGVHGANRLASNSLSEAVVFGNRISQLIKERGVGSMQPPDSLSFSLAREKAGGRLQEKRPHLQNLMMQHVGFKRTAEGLRRALDELEQLGGGFRLNPDSPEGFTYLNMLTCSYLIAKAALIREESRGGHFREDFPQPDDQQWKKHIIQVIGHDWMEERY